MIQCFFSAADEAKEKLIAVILTVMGRDGADGIEEIRKSGGHTIAQDEKSSVVFGMPKAAIESGKIDKVLPLEEIGKYLVNLQK